MAENLGTGMSRTNYHTGWISPEGMFYRCELSEHAFYTRFTPIYMRRKSFELLMSISNYVLKLN